MSEGERTFLDLQAGQTVEVQVQGEGKRELQHWHNKKMVRCGGGDCNLCEDGEEPRPSYVIPVFARQGHHKLRLSPTHYKSIEEARAGEIKGTSLRYTKTQTENGIRYSIVVLNPVSHRENPPPSAQPRQAPRQDPPAAAADYYMLDTTPLLDNLDRAAQALLYVAQRLTALKAEIHSQMQQAGDGEGEDYR